MVSPSNILIQKANAIADNWQAIKVLAFFSKKSVLDKLRSELQGHTADEVSTIYDLLSKRLSEQDMKKIVAFIKEAGQGRIK